MRDNLRVVQQPLKFVAKSDYEFGTQMLSIELVKPLLPSPGRDVIFHLILLFGKVE